MFALTGNIRYNYKTMKYLIRSIKYFIYFSLICSAMITALVLIGAVEGNINAIFAEGYASIGKIVLFFAVVAAVYPKVGFMARCIPSDRPMDETLPEIVKYLSEHNYMVESKSSDTVTFRLKNGFGRLAKMYEDRLTLTKTEQGYVLEGLRKDVMRLSVRLEHLCSL